ncbi:MAG: precorrin-3B C(17)-methyltransferase [Candidatus Omnitrophica bacterium]|nr:precorrin-3B C(17)-methyltransferase [Candidatus Omnitrophota bacterium]
MTTQNKGELFVVGIGPGSEEHLTPAALDAIRQAQVIVGYRTYIDLVRPLLEGKEIFKTGMTEEIGRARAAVSRAQAGEKVALISSGDPGVYGMAGLVFEVLREIGWKRGESPKLHIIPGITAMNSCSSLVGAPLVHDFCSVSLSDLLTPWPVIERRIEAAAQADFVIGLYNPKSGRRTKQIVIAQQIVSKYRKQETPVALVKSAYRDLETVILSDLAHFLDYEIGMLTTVIIGSTNSYVYEGYMVTPRGYTNKYSWDGKAHEGQKPGVSLRLNEVGKPV